ncbi:MAG: hypothetical protein HOP12_01195, partial [Candidatus Eisenbacteria bacterium]|nr:hypothetical protein [Candidatus Eisenbacteria bacterium]
GVTAARGGADNFIAFRYDGRPLGVVMSPPAGSAARVWLLDQDEWFAREAAGADVRFDERGASYVEVDAPRLYDVRRAGRHEKRLKLSPSAPGITLHAFRFGEVPPATR